VIELIIIIFKMQILAVGAEPLLCRFDMNGVILSQIQCAPPSAFSVSLHPSGVCSGFNYFFPYGLSFLVLCDC